MREFIFKSILFFLIPALPLLVIEGYILLLKDKIFSDEKMEIIFSNAGQNYNWINNISKPISLLSGSSSVRYGLSCSELNELSGDSIAFVNIAMDARDPIETYFIIKEIIKTSQVQSVYFGLDPWIYAKRYYKYRKKYLYLDMNLFTVLKYGFEHDKSILLKRYKALIDFFSKKLQKNAINEITIPQDFGSVKLENTPLNFNEPIYKSYQIEKYGWSKLQFTYLKKIAVLCNENNINFMVFIPPKRSDYSITYKTKCEIIHQQFVNNIKEQDVNVPIFGKFNQLDTLGDYKLFREAYHLNENGQKVYSKIFYEMINSDNAEFSTNYEWID